MAIQGVLGLAGLVVVVRVMRRGLHTYTARRKAMYARIRETQAALQKYNQAEPSSTQTPLLEAAVREIIALAGLESVWSVRREAGGLVLSSASTVWRVRHVSKQATLRSQKRVLHGTGHWEVAEHDNPHAPQTFTTLESLVHHLNTLLRPTRTG